MGDNVEVENYDGQLVGRLTGRRGESMEYKSVQVFDLFIEKIEKKSSGCNGDYAKV